jgi:hypothetical protein
MVEKGRADSPDQHGEVGAQQIPPEFDTAIYSQGKLDKENGLEEDNPFEEGTPQFESYAAGYAAGVAPEGPLATTQEGEDDDEVDSRSKLAKRSKKE